MEDELCVIPELGSSLYAAVFDGHGGDAAALWLNEHLHEYIQGALDGGSPPGEALTAAFEAADAELLQYLEANAASGGDVLTGAGSTASVLLVSEDSVVIANLGDSTAVLVRNGQDVVLTEAHRVYGKSPAALAEMERVKAAGGWIEDGRVCDVLAVSRAFGDWEFKGKGLDTLLRDGVKDDWWDQAFADSITFTADPVIPTPAVSTTPVGEAAGDEFLVVATDGLWDFYPQNEAMRFARMALKGGSSPQQVADELVERTLKRHTSDNIAVIVLKFPWAFTKRNVSNGGGKPRSKGKLFGIF